MNGDRQEAIQLLTATVRQLQDRARVPMQPSQERGVEVEHRDLERRAASARSTVDWMDALDGDIFWTVVRRTTSELEAISRGLTRIGL